MPESVTVFEPLKDGSQPQNDDGDDKFYKAAKQLAISSLLDQSSSNTQWNVFRSNRLINQHKDCDCSVYKFSITPPVVNVASSSGNKTIHVSLLESVEAARNETSPIKNKEQIFWCMSSSLEFKQTENSDFLLTTPSDNSRHKTYLVLNDTEKTWKSHWKKLCHSLQNNLLNNCNAYYKECKEIVIYHNGSQQSQVGQWIWENVRCDYSKRTDVVLL